MAATGERRRPASGASRLDLAAISGNTALVETTSAAWGEGRGAAPQSDWKTPTAGSESARKPGGTSRRFGGEHSSGVRRSAGAGVRQIRRDEPSARRGGRFGVGTLQPAARSVAEEMAVKLDAPGLSFHFEGLASADLAGRSRSVGILVKAGMTLPAGGLNWPG